MIGDVDERPLDERGTASTIAGTADAKALAEPRTQTRTCGLDPRIRAEAASLVRPLAPSGGAVDDPVAEIDEGGLVALAGTPELQEALVEVRCFPDVTGLDLDVVDADGPCLARQSPLPVSARMPFVIRFLSTGEGRNTTTRRAETGHASPVFGLRPIRSALARTVKLPNDCAESLQPRGGLGAGSRAPAYRATRPLLTAFCA